jgi:hypothetical protein
MNNRLPLFIVACAGVFCAPACHSSFAFAADPPRALSPSIDIEVEDRAPAPGTTHTAKFNVSLSNGHGDINVSDGDARYALSANTMSTTEPKLSLKIKRSDRSSEGDLEVAAAIPQQPNGRILLARIDRADGHITSIVAQAR